MRLSPSTPLKLEEDELLSSPEGEAGDSFHPRVAILGAGNLSDDLESSTFGSDEEVHLPQPVPLSPSHGRPHSSSPHPLKRAKLACVACRRCVVFNDVDGCHTAHMKSFLMLNLFLLLGTTRSVKIRDRAHVAFSEDKIASMSNEDPKRSKFDAPSAEKRVRK